MPLAAALDTTVVMPFPPPMVEIPAWKVVTPVIVATFTIFGASSLPTIPLLFIYQPKTIDNAIALPGDVLPLIDVSNALPDFAALASDASDAVPVKLPSNVVAVATPVTMFLG